MGETETPPTGGVAASRTKIEVDLPPSVPAEAVEVDFYRNPTILSRLILNQKYASAIKRLRLHPEEASVWVCSKRQRIKTSQMRHSALRSMMLGGRRHAQRRSSQEVVEYSLRQLPIHVACGSLFRTSDAKLRAELEKLITHLVVAYPDGCGMVDHEGKLPLHEAIWHNASPETISMLLMASPGTLHERDKFGRSPIELNRFRSGANKAEIKELLLLGVEFWKQARQEAKLRLKHAFVPPCSTSVGSVSVLAMNQSDMGSIGTGDSANRDRNPIPLDPSFRRPVKIESEEIEPIAWSQLEKRALHLEQLLAEMYEKNYELGEVIEELTRTKMELHDELELLQGADLAEEVLSLRRENTVLTKEVAKSQQLLKEQGFEARIAGSGSRVARSRSPRGSRGRASLNVNAVRQEEVIEYLEDRNSSLQQRVDELTELNREQQMKMERLEMVIGSLWKQGGGDNASEVASQEAMSWIHRSNQGVSNSSLDVDTTTSVAESSVKSSAVEDSSMASARSSAAVSVVSVPRGSDASLTSREDYANLLEKLQSGSRFATERFLAGKVRDLEEKLNSAIDNATAEVTASWEERNRLIKENEVLVAQVRALSSKSIMTGSSGEFHPGDPLKAGNLGELFERAAALYESDTSGGGSSSKTNPKKKDKDRKKSSKDESYLPGHFSSKPKAVDPYDDDDLEALVKKAQEVYGKPLPSYFFAALKGVASRNALSGSDRSTGASSSGDSSGSEQASVDNFFREAERIKGGPLPGDVLQAFQKASTHRRPAMRPVDEMSREDSSEGKSDAGKRSGDDSDEDSIRKNAEAILGGPMSDELAQALVQGWPDSDRSQSDSQGGFFEDSTASRADSYARSANSSSGGPLRRDRREFAVVPPPALNEPAAADDLTRERTHKFSNLSPAETVRAIQEASRQQGGSNQDDTGGNDKNNNIKPRFEI